MFAVLLSFLSAVLESAKDVYFSTARTKNFAHVVRALYLPLFSLPLVLVVLFFQGVADIQEGFWLFAISHAVLMVVANYCYLRALAVSPVSQTQPILALSTVFLIVTTPLLTDDQVTAWGWVGVLLVGAGIYATQYPERPMGATSSVWAPFVEMWKQKGVVWMLATAFIYSITPNLDKLAVLTSDSPTYLVVDYSLTALLTLIMIIIGLSIGRIGKDVLHSSGAALQFAPGGFLNAAATLTQVWALTFLPVPYVIALKRLSIVFTSLWGYVVRKERVSHWISILGVFVVFGGVAVILLFGKL
ncbi:MAG: EamA family transporter [bacterium]|nr:EamA family transporter [bacterium]